MGATAWMDLCMQRCGIQPKPRRVIIHYLVLLGEQLAAMLPLSLLQVCKPAAAPTSDHAVACLL